MMTDVLCWRCRIKLGWRDDEAQGVTIKCMNCGAKNQVMPESKLSALALGATGA